MPPGASGLSPGPGVLLPHLAGPAAAIRQVVAGHALTGLDHIVEIGGAGLPVTGFLRHRPQSVTVIDPKIEPWEADKLDGRPCRVRHLCRKFVDADADAVQPGTGVVLLGLSLKPLGTRPAVTAALVSLCARASRVVLEYSLSLDRALSQVPELVDRAGLVELWGVDLGLRDGLLVQAGHDQRRLLVLEARRSP